MMLIFSSRCRLTFRFKGASSRANCKYMQLAENVRGSGSGAGRDCLPFKEWSEALPAPYSSAKNSRARSNRLFNRPRKQATTTITSLAILRF